MSEKLFFEIANNKIVELFGLQNFTSKEIAILELIKNSYDAGASKTIISIKNDEIDVFDDGEGMTKDIIRNKWMHVGTSDKGYLFKTHHNEQRVYSGSKGIGRFALSRLGKNVEVYSKSKNNAGLLWMTDWTDNILDDYQCDFIGTNIVIKDLNDRWNEKEVEKLVDYISSFKNFDSFDVIVEFNEKKYHCNNIFKTIKLGETALAEIVFNFDSNTNQLTLNVNSSEFNQQAQTMIDEYRRRDKSGHNVPISIDSFETCINLLDNRFSSLQNMDFADYSKALKKLGCFSGKLFFNNNYTKLAAMDFCYQWPKTVTAFPKGLNGLYLMRNAFCISGYDGSNDWFGISKRARKSPAAATHPTGKWRIRENQLLGSVYIDKEINKSIVELQNRQGIEENNEFFVLKYIIDLVLSCFEEYRQSIIRIIDKKNFKAIEVNPSLSKAVQRFLSKPQTIEKMSSSEVKDLASGIQQMVDETNVEKEKYKRKQSDLDYASRILNSLSTAGLKSVAIAHELHTKRNNISAFKQSMVKALQKYEYWDVLNDGNHTKQKVYNIPALLNEVDETNTTIVYYIDSMLSSVNKQKYVVCEIEIKETIETICELWRNEYSWLTFNIEMDDIKLYSSKDIFETIFNNLILNSIQQNDKNKTLSIFIKVTQIANKEINIIYKDDGVGLSEKYINNPYLILEPHETSRLNGHGLGMWIVYSTITNNKGEVLDINGEGGFLFNFSLKGRDDGQD